MPDKAFIMHVNQLSICAPTHDLSTFIFTALQKILRNKATVAKSRLNLKWLPKTTLGSCTVWGGCDFVGLSESLGIVAPYIIIP